MALPPPNFNRPAPIPGAIPRPGGIPARPPGGGIPPRPGAATPATQALPSAATATSALHPVQTTALPTQRSSQQGQPDAAQEFVMQFKKQLLPYLVQALDPKLLERGNEAALKKRIEDLVDERLTADKVPIG